MKQNKINFSLDLLLAMVFNHSNRKVTKTETEIGTRSRVVLRGGPVFWEGLWKEFETLG